MKKKPTLGDQLSQFLSREGWPNREWISDRYMSVYIRKAKRLIDKELKDTLDLASIEVQERHQRKGRWSFFLTLAEAMVTNHKKIRYIFIENVINPHLQASLLRRGYQPYGEGSLLKFFPDAASNES